MLSGVSRLRPVTAAAERWLLVVTAAFCCGLSGILAAGLWLPPEPVYLWGGALATAVGAVLVYYKAIPGHRGAIEPSMTAASLSHGRSVWEDLD
jgi:hypothetical protein